MEQVGRNEKEEKKKAMLATSIYRVSIRGKNEAIRILWPREDLLSFIVPRFEKMCSGGLETFVDQCIGNVSSIFQISPRNKYRNK